MTPGVVPLVAGAGALPLVASAEAAAAAGSSISTAPGVPLVSLARSNVAGPPAGPPHTSTAPVVGLQVPACLLVLSSIDEHQFAGVVSSMHPVSAFSYPVARLCLLV